MEYVEVLLPTVFVAIIFFFVIRALFNADRNEREAQAEVFEEHGINSAPTANSAKSTEEKREDTTSNSSDKANNE
ncbi:hypothetical protein [Neomicrococcus lactis]|uniref:hypothetical protein n=1 Tax=Neomicrococcus lactis TaxID=732241 RepID=UPI0023004DFF|nr:hypothetical protein [Neomicrococcus lactis]